MLTAERDLDKQVCWQRDTHMTRTRLRNISKNLKSQCYLHLGMLALVLQTKPTTGLADVNASLEVKKNVVKIAGFEKSEILYATCRGKTPQPRTVEPKPKGSLVLLHGRGGAQNLETLVESVRVAACKLQLHVVAPAAPTRDKNWPFETTAGEGQDKYLLKLLRHEIPVHFGLTHAKAKLPLLLVGISAGATFLMGDFYPRHAHNFHGVAIALCGGSWPNAIRIEKSKTLDKNFPLFVQIGKSDFLIEQVHKGLGKYADMGLPVRARFMDAPGHCAFDFNDAILETMKSLTPTKEH